MQINKKFIILLLIMFAIVAFLALYFLSTSTPMLTISNNSSNNTDNNNGNNSNTSNSNTINNNGNGNQNISTDNSQTLSLVNDYQEFFNINSLINTYYSDITSKKYTEVLKLLDPSYIINNGITEKSITNYIDNRYSEVIYFSKTIYVKAQNGIKYYFINGEEQLYSFGEETLEERENIKYLVIVDTNNGDTYSITPLNTNLLFDYAQNYKMLSSKKIEFNNYNKHKKEKYSDQTISVYYLNYFRDILYLNTQKAYNMLSTEYRNTFTDYEDFANHIEEVYSLLNSNIYGYSIDGNDGKRSYSIITMKESYVDFTETSIMNFKVSIT